MIAVKYQPEIEITYSEDEEEVTLRITKINNYGNVKNEMLSFPSCNLEAVIHALVDVKGSIE